MSRVGVGAAGLQQVNFLGARGSLPGQQVPYDWPVSRLTACWLEGIAGVLQHSRCLGGGAVDSDICHGENLKTFLVPSLVDDDF